MAGPLAGAACSCWMAWGGIDLALRPRADACSRPGFRRSGDPCRPACRPAHDRRLGRAARLSACPPGCGPGCMLSNGLYRRRAAHPPDLGDRADGSVRPRPRPDGPAGKLVRAGQSRTSQTICIDLAYRLPGRRLPDLHLRRRRRSEPAADHRPQLRGVVSRAAAAGGPRILVRPRLSATSATPGSSTAGTRPAAALPGRLRTLCADRVAAVACERRRRARDRHRAGLRRADVEIALSSLQHSAPDTCCQPRLRSHDAESSLDASDVDCRPRELRMTAGWFLTLPRRSPS